MRLGSADNEEARASTLRFLCNRGVLTRNLMIAMIVGTVLSFANQFDVIWREPFNARLGAKIFFNYLVPFTVSSVSAALNRKS